MKKTLWILSDLLFVAITLPMCGKSNLFWEDIGTDTDTDTDIDSDADSDTDTDSDSIEEFVSIWRITDHGNTGDYEIWLPLSSSGEYNFTVNWGDGTKDTITTFADAERIHTYEEEGEYEVRITGKIKGMSFQGFGDPERLIEIKSWGPFAFGDTHKQFKDCVNLTISATDIPDLTGTTSLKRAFAECSSLTQVPSITEWDISNVTDMSEMFAHAIALDQDLSGLDTTSVTDMSGMFIAALAFNGDVSSWDTSNVTDMSGMFAQAQAFNRDISGWDTSNVTDMGDMFREAVSFDQDLSNWDTSKVVDMVQMFLDATSFNQDVSAWDTSSVVRMKEMFSNASAFDQDLSTWDISSVTDMEEMFLDIALSTANYDSLLIGWESQDGQDGVVFNGGLSNYSSGAPAEARARLIHEHGWTIKDGGQAP